LWTSIIGYPLPRLPPPEDLLPEDLEPPEDLMLPEDLELPDDLVAPEDLELLEDLVDLVFDPDLVEDEFLIVLDGLVALVLDRVVPFERAFVPLVFRLVLVAALDNLLVE
jgi:hypothetical protein